jgi:hypothetical protein
LPQSAFARALQLTIDYQHQIDALYPQVESTLLLP